MNAPYHTRMEEESPPSPILTKLPSTPTKNPLSFDLFHHTESPHEMMLVETPVKQQPQFIDTLLEYQSPPKQLFQEQISSLMEQESPQYSIHEKIQSGIQNQHPNFTPTQLNPTNLLKLPEHKQQKQHTHNSTFKTPGRSQRSNPLSTSHKRKPCTCKKSGCLKKYCECFKAGEVCDENCDCVGCKNNDPVYAKSGTKSSVKTYITTCNCKKSNCTKGYCDCHNAGALCSELCNCVECKNQILVTSEFEGETEKRKGKKVHWEDEGLVMMEEEPMI